MLQNASDMFLNINRLDQYFDVSCDLVLDGCPSLQPEITIVIPTFRRVHLLKQAIDSAVAQVFGVAFEIIVVDNEPNVEYASQVDHLVSSYFPANIRLFRNASNIGMFGNWNRCINVSRGGWISILNDDDLLDKYFLRDIWSYREKEQIVFCKNKSFTRAEDIVVEYENRSERLLNTLLGCVKSLDEAQILTGNPIPGTLGTLIPRSIALKLGGFNEEYWPSADYNFMIRAWLYSGLKEVNIYRAFYRWSDNESLKVDTLYGFLGFDLKMRRAYIDLKEYSYFRKKALNSVVNLQARAWAHYVYPSFNDLFDVDHALNANSLRRRKPFLMQNWVFRFKYLWRIMKLIP